MAARRKGPANKRSRRGSTANRRRSLVVKVVLSFVVILLVAVGATWAWLDREVSERFRQRHLAAAVHVYSRPVEWFPGTRVDRQRATETLLALGYREGAGALLPGSYRPAASEIEIATRDFEYSDEIVPSTRVRVRFGDGSIRGIVGLDNDTELPVLMLGPVAIGSLESDQHEDRTPLKLHQVPDRFLQVLLLVEDRHFMSHVGIDLRAIARALWSNIRSGRITQGGSTVSQQLVKNLYLSSEQTLRRKVMEALYALVLELRFEKHEILEAYINEVFLAQAGNRAIHGFELGSRYFFGRSLAQLDLADYALLVGMVKAPSAYNPRRFPDRARERRDLVLGILASEGLIDDAQLRTLINKPIGVIDAERGSHQSYAGFLDLVRRQVAEQGISDPAGASEVKVWSTMDVLVQHATERALSDGLFRIENQRGMPAGTLQGAAVVLRAENGQVVAMAGDRRPGYAGFNRALDARRPVGSLLKPLIALTALESPRGYHLASPVDDSAFSLTLPNGQTWTPENYDKSFHGVVPMLSAIEQSYNIASARLGVEVGVGPFVSRLGQLALGETPAPYPSTLLGAVEMSPLEVARLYLPFASGGLGFPLRAYVTATDENRRLLSRNPSSTTRLINADTHFLLNYLLRGVVDRGTAQSNLGEFGRRMALAGKTGTTDGHRDSWFAGYSGNYLAVIWVGRDDNQPTGLSGSNGALPVWHELMSSLPLRPAVFDTPSSIEWHSIDAVSGFRVGRSCDTAIEVPFINGGSLPPSSGCGEMATVERQEEPKVSRWLSRLFSPGKNPAQGEWEQSGRR